jgi:hypothetical protein
MEAEVANSTSHPVHKQPQMTEGSQESSGMCQNRQKKCREKLSVRQPFAFSVKGGELVDIRIRLNYSEGSFFRRERRRRRYGCPSSLYDAAAPLSKISQSWARLPSCDYSALSMMASSLLRQPATVSAFQNPVRATTPSEWPFSRPLACSLLPLSGKKPISQAVSMGRCNTC